MNLDFGSIMQLMMASSLMSGRGFDMNNFMGDLTFDKLLGLQMISSTNFGNMFGNSTVNTSSTPSPVLTKEQFEQLKSLFESKQ